MRWRPITTFLQTLIDMKNAQIPDGYRAFAHDYRPDLTRFVAEVFDLPASDEQIRDIEERSRPASRSEIGCCRRTLWAPVIGPRPRKPLRTARRRPDQHGRASPGRGSGSAVVDW